MRSRAQLRFVKSPTMAIGVLGCCLLGSAGYQPPTSEPLARATTSSGPAEQTHAEAIPEPVPDQRQERHSSGHEAPQMTMEEIFRLGRVHASGAVPDEARQSLPVPIVESGNLFILFFFSPGLASPTEGVKLAPPEYLALLHSSTGKLERIQAVTPSFFGQPQAPGEIIGVLTMPENMTAQEFLQKRSELFGAYDILLPYFAEGSKALDPDGSRAATQFSELFRVLSEAPLWPYYQTIGRGFFDWLDQFVSPGIFRP